MSPSIVVESGIEFDFTKAASYTKHDAKHSYWKGVDFEIEEPNGNWVWVEAKNWEPMTLPPRYRGGKRWSFLCKMRSGVKSKSKKKGRSYFQDLREKFCGTSTFLTLNNAHPQTAIEFVVLIESPKLTPDLLVRAVERMPDLMPLALTKMPIPVSVSVLNVAEWNRRFPEYPAKTL